MVSTGSRPASAEAIVQAAANLVGDADAAQRWYCSEPLAVFANATAERMVADGRAEDVLRYLDSLQVGAAG